MKVDEINFIKWKELIRGADLAARITESIISLDFWEVIIFRELFILAMKTFLIAEFLHSVEKKQRFALHKKKQQIDALSEKQEKNTAFLP